MKKFIFIFILFFIITIPAVKGQSAVISEILIDGVNEQAASNNDEFVEIYNPTGNPIDISNWTIDYRSASSSTFNNKYTFPAGTILQSHKYYLFGGGGVANRDNFSQSVLIGMSNTGGGVFLRNSSGTTIDLIGWGTAAASNYEGTVATKPAQGISLERKANTSSTVSSMGSGGADEFAGNGFDSNNNANDFLQRATPQPQNSNSPAEPVIDFGGNGTGVATVTPAWINASESTTLSFKVVGDGTHTLDSVLIVIPTASGWAWSGNLTDVILSGSASAAPTVSIVSDTIYIGSIAITSTDNLLVDIKNITAPSKAGFADFNIKTALLSGVPQPIAAFPRIKIIKVIPIVQLHVNDAQGVSAAPYGLGTSVTFSGIITADYNPAKTDIYVQDATAGIDVYSASRYFGYAIGDSVTITGTVTQFRGLTEIAPDSSLLIIHSHGNAIPEPKLITAQEVNLTFHSDDFTEPNEGRLVRINNVTYNSANSTITDATGTTSAYTGTLIVPAGTFDLIGILKQYKPGTTVTPPYTADYEVNPRFQEDIVSGSNLSFSSAPKEENIQANSVTISFKTSGLVQTVIKYGMTSAYSDSIVVTQPDTVHAIELTPLNSATVYHYQVGARDESGTNFTGDAIFSTAAPIGSTGKIDVFFNHSTNPSVSTGEAAQTVNISQKFIDRINAAKYSIDIALYSLSGTVGANIASALVSAKGRGVKVRVIGEKDNQGTAPWTTLRNNGIPVIDDGFDPANGGLGLMHNKFGIFDFRDTTSFLDDWIWSGSWNATDPGNNNDAQNAIEIQDKSLANVYTIEFNEMWGSSTDAANASNSRFGIRKIDNTPHKFIVNGTPIELYFDPSDNTSMHIGEVLKAAKYSINVAMLTFTRDDLAQILISKKASGTKVRVLLDNNSDAGNEFANLLNGNIDVHLKGSAVTGLLHHKYAIVDAENAAAEPITITGSHNWSSAAETANNENTLIIHSPLITNLYLQEFTARYYEAGGTDSLFVGVEDGVDVPSAYSLNQNYPNPFNPTTTIQYSLNESGKVDLAIYNMLGQKVATLVNEFQNSGSHIIKFDASQLASGVYLYRINANNFSAVKKLLLLK